MSGHFRFSSRGPLACLLVLTFALTAAAQKTRTLDAGQIFKNLGGPAAEIDSMRLPDPATVGSRSKAVMLPLTRGERLRELEIPIDRAENFKLMLLSPAADGIVLRAAYSEGEYFDLRAEGLTRGVSRESSTYGLDGNRFPAEVFSFESVKTGRLRLQIEMPADLQTGSETIGYLVASSETPYRLYSYIDTFHQTVGREIGLAASLYEHRASDETGRPAALRGTIREAFAVVATPDGESLTLPLAELGSGEWRAPFTPGKAGSYRAQIFVRGTTPDGDEFLRSAEHSLEIAAGRVAFPANVRATRRDELRWRLAIPVEGLSAGQKVLLHGEVWGRDGDGNEFPVSWLGGLALAEREGKRGAAVALILDARWLAQNASAESYELRNVRVQHPDSLAVLGEAARFRLPGVYVPAAAQSFAGLVTDEMRQGARPAKTADEAVGGRLMLVHGYCSGDAWGSAAAAGQFTNYVKFLDLNQNRSHDQFANLIRNFGAALPSFGIVAHSQGGAASLHLYTYYWSGLDYATGPRLIQSVGTPYRGTALAGNLALLGQIFGAGCGSNYDLTYNGAAAWLANIPSWARAKVFYHTTSFADVWWRYDYCNIATDPFLGDPDDGVVERAYAQLSGGVNLGHKTGWCHTTGMRDPGQTTDASRNANMNANAAR